MEAIPANTSSFVIDQEIINTSINNKKGIKYPINNAKGPKDFSNTIFTFSPVLNFFPVVITSITLLSTSETEQVALVWQVEHPDTLSKLTLTVLGVTSFTTPQC